ncbi:MAG: type II toxin-antitoxin system Phd/YefM family antitoxin [Candidatus Omnitrophica bacterium]|nr:type II toxin-antitoxin system Phd/YefM family antitoxin [Candidatus Omnitrophota bacterium]
MTKTIPAVEARIHFGEIMKRAFKKGERFIVEKSGIPMIAILSANEYMQFIQEREEQFQIIDRIKARLPDIPAEEVENDVRHAVQAIRKQRA